MVLATASASSRDHVLALGADRVIDRHAERFEEHARDIDLVLDLVGGETLDRSWQVLAGGGAIVSTAAPDIAAMVLAGTVRSTIARIVGVDALAQAIEESHSGHAPGKVVVDFTR